jgi:Xaa-Pro aminopeptidase
MEKIAEVYRARRERLLKQLSPQSALILISGPLKIRNGDTHYPFRPQSDFYYLTGYVEPDAVLILVPGREAGQNILCHLSNDPSKELWEGKRVGHFRACKDYYFDSAFPIDELDLLLNEIFPQLETLYYPLDDTFLKSVVEKYKEENKKRSKQVFSCHDINEIVHEMRLIKDTHEIELMRKSANISALTHQQVMKTLKPGMTEWFVDAMLSEGFAKQGARFLAYPSIVAGGDNACTLHYVENNCVLKEGDLVLIDAGGEYGYYASDITRTYPVGKQFTPAQKALYQIVLQAQEAVIACIKPGCLFDDLQVCAIRVITTGLVDLAILVGDVETLIAQKAYQAFYMHGVSHWLGLDVHDVGARRVKEQSRPLQAGMVLTVEPGIYISEKTTGIDKKWLGIGIRIEDDVLVTQTGAEVLTHGVPKTVDEIESLRCQF